MTLLAERAARTWENERFKQRPHFLGLTTGARRIGFTRRFSPSYVRYLRDPVAQYLWNENLTPTRSCRACPPCSAWGRKSRPAEPELPPALVYRDQPMVFFRTGWRPGDTLICLNAIRHVPATDTRIRGAVIFEYNGEALLPDPRHDRL